MRPNRELIRKDGQDKLKHIAINALNALNAHIRIYINIT